MLFVSYDVSCTRMESRCNRYFCSNQTHILLTVFKESTQTARIHGSVVQEWAVQLLDLRAEYIKIPTTHHCQSQWERCRLEDWASTRRNCPARFRDLEI